PRDRKAEMTTATKALLTSGTKPARTPSGRRRAKNRSYKALEPSGIGIVIRWIWLSLAAIICFFPFYAMVVLSLKPGAIVELPGSLLPWNFSTAAYEQVLGGQNLLMWLLNTFIYSIVSVVAVLFLSSLAGYAFAKKRFYVKH